MKSSTAARLRATLARTSRLRPDDVRIHAQLLACLCLIEVLVRATPLRVTCRVMGVRLSLVGGVAPDILRPLPGHVQQRVRAVDRIVTRAPFPDTCLRRSLLTCVALRPLDPVLRLGWVPQPPPGNAHAWVEIGEYNLEGGLEGVIPLQASR